MSGSIKDIIKNQYGDDLAKATNKLGNLATGGNADAQFNLGRIYEYCSEVKVDIIVTYWYRMAAKQGHAEAQYNLGWMYQFGKGVPQDNKKAHMWYNIAQSNDHNRAGEGIKSISWLTTADISKAQDMAKRCLSSGYQNC